MSETQQARNEATFRRVLDATNAHDEELIAKTIDDVFQPDVRIDTPLPIPSTGVRAIQDVYAALFRAFPDIHIEADDVIAADDKLVCRQTVTGTHLGEYMGLAPTGKPVRYSEIFIFRFSDGRIAETWGVVDVLTQMQQLGVLPARTVPHLG